MSRVQKFPIQFEWDEKKNELNYKKHDIWFEEAQTVFFDPLHIMFYDDEHSTDEDRYLIIGTVYNDRVLIVSFTHRNAGQNVRIISARKTTRKERLYYEKGIYLIQIEKS